MQHINLLPSLSLLQNSKIISNKIHQNLLKYLFNLPKITDEKNIVNKTKIVISKEDDIL